MAAQGSYHLGKILARRVASPNVVVLELEVPSLSFHPGQWVDFMVPPNSWIGGFSPASTPSDLPRVTLAVKRSSYQPSRWVHSNESMEIGRTVHVQVGGKCVLDTRNIHSQSAMFCAGGIGISPLLSMYRYWNELQEKTPQTMHEKCSPSASFLYSVSTEKELVFHELLVNELRNSNNHNCSQQLTFTLTQQKGWSDSLKQNLESQGVVCRTGRFMKEFLQEAQPTSSFYLCGPPSMLDEGVNLIKERGVNDDNIHFEKWW